MLKCANGYNLWFHQIVTGVRILTATNYLDLIGNWILDIENFILGALARSSYKRTHRIFLWRRYV